MVALTQSLHIPTEEETKISKESSRILAAHISEGVRHLKIVEADGSEETATIPAVAYRLFVDILTQMSQGNAVTIIPIHAELTTQEAADLINVSRPFLIKQLEEGIIPYHKVGKHRRVRFTDLMEYKTNIDAARSKILDEIVAISEELGLYD
jgi:excisionase family DNA binding protein